MANGRGQGGRGSGMMSDTGALDLDAALDRAAQYIAGGLADPIAAAVAAERARAAQAVREIVGGYVQLATFPHVDPARRALAENVARECLAAVEAQR